MNAHLIPVDPPECLVRREAKRRDGQVIQCVKCGDGTVLCVSNNGAYYTPRGKVPTAPARYMVWELRPFLYHKLQRTTLDQLLYFRWAGRFLKGERIYTPVQLERKLTQLSYLHR